MFGECLISPKYLFLFYWSSSILFSPPIAREIHSNMSLLWRHWFAVPFLYKVPLICTKSICCYKGKWIGVRYFGCICCGWRCRSLKTTMVDINLTTCNHNMISIMTILLIKLLVLRLIILILVLLEIVKLNTTCNIVYKPVLIVHSNKSMDMKLVLKSSSQNIVERKV